MVQTQARQENEAHDSVQQYKKIYLLMIQSMAKVDSVFICMLLKRVQFGTCYNAMLFSQMK